jgi:hypothetical protein
MIAFISCLILFFFDLSTVAVESIWEEKNSYYPRQMYLCNPRKPTAPHHLQSSDAYTLQIKDGQGLCLEKHITLEQPLTIGYAKDNDIILNNAPGDCGISRYHAIIIIKKNENDSLFFHVKDYAHHSGLIPIVDSKDRQYIKASNGQFNFYSDFNKPGPINIKAISDLSIPVEKNFPITLTTVPSLLKKFPDLIRYEDLYPNVYRRYSMSINSNLIPMEEKLTVKITQTTMSDQIQKTSHLTLKVPPFTFQIIDFKYCQLEGISFFEHLGQFQPSNIIELYNFLHKHSKDKDTYIYSDLKKNIRKCLSENIPKHILEDILKNLKYSNPVMSMHPLDQPWFYFDQNQNTLFCTITKSKVVHAHNELDLLIEFFKRRPTSIEIEHLFFLYPPFLKTAKDHHAFIFKVLRLEKSNELLIKWRHKILRPLANKYDIAP